MELKILGKKYKGNVKTKTNTVYFELDGKELEIEILYVNHPVIGKRNVLVDGKNYILLEHYIKENYECDFEDFKNYFLSELRRYSNNRNLDPVNFKFL